MATKSPRSQAFLLGTRLVRIARSSERTIFSDGGRLLRLLLEYLRLFTPQAAEESRIHLSFSVGSSCVEMSVFREIRAPPKNHINNTKKPFLQNVKRCRDHYAKKQSNKVWAWQYAIKAGMMAYNNTKLYKNTKLNIHSPKMSGWGYVCLTPCFFMPSSLPLLHTAMPTPCLNAFGIAIPTSFYIM